MKQLALSAARVLAVAVVLYVAVGLLLRYTSVINQFIYFPDSTIYQDPGDFGLEFEDVYLTTSDGVRIHGWFVPGSGGPTLIWFHGNGGNISNRADNIAGLNRRLGVSILIIDYRGYGLSDGSPNEQGTYLDAEAAVTHALSRPDVDPERVVLFGRSLGCAVAAEMAVRHDVLRRRAGVAPSPLYRPWPAAPIRSCPASACSRGTCTIPSARPPGSMLRSWSCTATATR